MQCKSAILCALLLSFLFGFSLNALGTGVSQMSITNLEGYPGETITQEMKLEGIHSEEREGFWYTYYKDMGEDNERMDITSWITIEPEDFTIKAPEIKVFTVTVKIPKDAGPGLWGAISEEAGKPGHSAERRTYVIFKDAPAGANIYSGLLIPVSVNVLPSLNPLAPAINFVEQNLLVVLMAIVIIVLVVVLLRKKKKQVSRI